MRFTPIPILLALLLAFPAYAKICPKCGLDHLPDDPPKEKTETEKEPPPTTTEEEKEDDVVLSVSRQRFQTSSIEIADACDKILDRLEARYGKPKVWKAFPVYFRRYTGNGIAGYTQYGGGRQPPPSFFLQPQSAQTKDRYL